MSLKQSAPSTPLVVLTKPTVIGNSNSSNSNIGYIPSGLLIAIILHALRLAQDNDLERQKLQAQTEQAYDTQLGGLNGDPSKGLIAIAAESVVNAGKEQADGLITQGISSAVNAAVSGAVAIGTVGMMKVQSSQTDPIEGQIKAARSELAEIEGPEAAQKANPQTAPAGTQPTVELSNNVKDYLGETGAAQRQTLAAQPNHAMFEKVTTRIREDIKMKTSELEPINAKFNQLMAVGKQISDAAGAAAGAAGNVEKAGHDVAAAADNAAADVGKTVQQMSTSAASKAEEAARAAGQQAIQVSDSLAQVAASQVQMRG